MTMEKSDLIEGLSKDIITYVMHGEFAQDSIAAEVKYDELDERFNDYELLMDLHFILKPEVVKFVRKLPHRIRSIKTQTRNVSKTQRGSVEGRINWSKTVKKRYSGNPRDNSLFVCDNRSEHYDIGENIVLKRLLSIIYNTLNEAEEYLDKDYSWVNDRWKNEGDDLVEEMKRIFERDVHVKRISEPEEYEPTDRMMETARNSRQEIYTDAFELLETREDIFKGEQDSLENLLKETAITPDDEETLMELFVLFSYIRSIEKIREEEQFSLKTISSGKQEIARIEGEKDIVLYHDSSARDRDLSFYPDVIADEDGGTKTTEELKNEEKKHPRTEKVHKKTHVILDQYFKDKDFQEHTGRPDVIVLEIIDNSTGDHRYLITEVKNSTKEETIRNGIKETLEYLAFMRQDGKTVFGDEENQEYFGAGKNGVLVVQDLDRETRKRQDQEEINILQVSELKDELPDLLKDII